MLDAEGAVRYIGVSRSVAQSLRLHLARMPELTYAFKVFHITRPSRAILEMTRQAWITELGAAPEVRGSVGGWVGGKWSGDARLDRRWIDCSHRPRCQLHGLQGNDNGPQQALWENALDVKPLMTAEDHAFIGQSVSPGAACLAGLIPSHPPTPDPPQPPTYTPTPQQRTPR